MAIFNSFLYVYQRVSFFRDDEHPAIHIVHQISQQISRQTDPRPLNLHVHDPRLFAAGKERIALNSMEECHRRCKQILGSTKYGA